MLAVEICGSRLRTTPTHNCQGVGRQRNESVWSVIYDGVHRRQIRVRVALRAMRVPDILLGGVAIDVIRSLKRREGARSRVLETYSHRPGAVRVLVDQQQRPGPIWTVDRIGRDERLSPRVLDIGSRRIDC